MIFEILIICAVVSILSEINNMGQRIDSLERTALDDKSAAYTIKNIKTK